MKKLLFVALLLPGIAFSQSKKEKKAREKNDKIILQNLRTTVAYLADDRLEGRRTGTPGNDAAAAYIAAAMQGAGLIPAGNDGFLQEFVIDEGKKPGADNILQVNNQTLQFQQDYIVLPFSPNVLVKGQVSTALNEVQQPWFTDIAPLLEENRNNPHFSLTDALKTKAAKCAAKGATALFVHNSGNVPDHLVFDKNDSSSPVKIPVVYMQEESFKKYLGNAATTHKIDLLVSLAKELRKARNVIGRIDNHAPATVVIGAHYDHLGRGEDGNTLDQNQEIHNGADDNASGVAAMLELAKLLQSSPAKATANNYLFIAFTAEELGLLGSKYWLEHPTIQTPLNYMINLDMVGRYDTARKLTVGGYGTTPVWSSVITAANTDNLVIKPDSSGSGPSDHAAFYRKNIPVLFFFTNSHADYHKATDDADKLNYEGELQVIHYIYNIIQQADGQGKLAFLPTRDPQTGPSRSFTVSLGILPDYAFTGSGVRIEGVSQGKAAEKTGLQSGDVLLRLGDHPFVDIQGYMEALGKFRKGDRTTVTIRRGSATQTYPVTF